MDKLSESQVEPVSVPRAFGRYQLFDRIGVGGMAEIFLARARTELGVARLVVVKQILPQLSGNEMFADMLIAEAKLAARLSHANVVQVFDLGRHEDVLFIAMEYVEGFDLNDLLRRCARSRIPLPVDFALLIVMEALRGLGYAHRCAGDSGAPIGIVHRDVSPSNVLISFEGEVKLCDFGIARANDMADLLSDEVIKGKAGYMSPEQARGESLDARADLFAAGIVLWELLAGRKLYKTRPTGPSLLDLAREASIPALPTRGLPNEDELHAIVSRALAKNRNDRYPAAQAMLRDLETYVGRSRLIASPIR
ncbi:MAG: serine/threonine protein kinase, partial [Polyangiaceae bacterium]|nr:serine/threonine protein kinase [Polyangiaceae bacterium]